MRRTTVPLVLLAAVAPVAPAAADETREARRQVRKLHQAPFPASSTTGTCADAPTELHADRFGIRVRRAGRLDIALHHTGTWDIALASRGKELVSKRSDGTSGAPATFSVELSRGQRLGIVVCNISGAPDATLTVSFSA